MSAERAGVASLPRELPGWGGAPKGFSLLLALLMGARSREQGVRRRTAASGSLK